MFQVLENTARNSPRVLQPVYWWNHKSITKALANKDSNQAARNLMDCEEISPTFVCMSMFSRFTPRSLTFEEQDKLCNMVQKLFDTPTNLEQMLLCSLGNLRCLYKNHPSAKVKQACLDCMKKALDFARQKHQ